MIPGCNSTYRLRYWNPVNSTLITAYNKYLVATALTVYGIETIVFLFFFRFYNCVATALTVYGIETDELLEVGCQLLYVATALTVYGIETCSLTTRTLLKAFVATALTVYGIETWRYRRGGHRPNSRQLQQHLPFTVLKRLHRHECILRRRRLQQHLPFTVLKRVICLDGPSDGVRWLQQHLPFTVLKRVIFTHPSLSGF